MILNMDITWCVEDYATFSVLYDNEVVEKFVTDKVKPCDFGTWLTNTAQKIRERRPLSSTAVIFYGNKVPYKKSKVSLPEAPEGYVYQLVDGKCRLLKL